MPLNFFWVKGIMVQLSICGVLGASPVFCEDVRLMTDVFSEKCIIVYQFSKERVIEINCSRSLAKSNDLPKSLSQVGIDYLDSLILRVTLGTKYPKINLYWRPLRDGGKHLLFLTWCLS